jgi:glycosyltransferase involved in cell wall biosynthesis
MGPARPLLVAHSDSGGGAARAALRLHGALCHAGVESSMLVRASTSGEPGLQGPRTPVEALLGRLRSPIGRALMRLQRPMTAQPRSGNFVPSRWARRIAATDADIVHLHWIGDETMSIEDIGRIPQPVVWTLHDMWAFCGTEHVQPSDARWVAGYSRDNRAAGDRGLDLDCRVWRRKHRAWRPSWRIVAPSGWMAGCAARSALLRDLPVTVIPNVLDTATFQPGGKRECRAALGLDDGWPLVLFGAIHAGADPNKGLDLLMQALQRLAVASPRLDLSCAVFGADAPPAGVTMPVPTRWLGRIDDDAMLARVYAAGDVMVVPSRIENLPQTATEAQACGCPVVGFRTAGLPDAVDDRRTGWLARAFDVDDLAAGIRWVIEDRERHRGLSTAARQRAVRLWHADVVLPRYLEQYALAMEAARPLVTVRAGSAAGS